MKSWNRVFLNEIETLGLLSWPLIESLQHFNIAETSKLNFRKRSGEVACSCFVTTEEQHSLNSLASLHSIILRIIPGGSTDDSDLYHRVDSLDCTPKSFRIAERKNVILNLKLLKIVFIFLGVYFSVKPVVGVLRHITIRKIL